VAQHRPVERARKETMGIVRVSCGETEREVQLARSVLVGRHPTCHVVLDHPDVPVYWLELRWLGDQWGWRPFREESGRTRGAGRMIRTGWREMKEGRIRCTDEVWIELSDAAEPQLFAEDLQTGEHLTDESLEGVVEPWSDQVRFVDWESKDSPQIKDCSVHIVEGRSLRFHVPQKLFTTNGDLLPLSSPYCELDLYPDALRATFTVGPREITVSGECVRILWVYAQVRLEDEIAEGGWLSRDEVHHLWVDLGGREDSPVMRMGWEKGKLRTRLSKAGATGLETLFENRSQHGQQVSRLAFDPERIAFL
jgi:hypothetical protein